MKKSLTLCLALVLGVLLVACNTPTEEPKPELSRGSIEEAVYRNEYLGISFHKPASWVYSTDEEIANMMSLVAENMLNENLKETLENNPSIIDMMVVDTLTRTNINVTYENLAKTFSTNITVEQYVDAVKQQMANVSGMTVTFPDQLEKVMLGSTEFTKCLCTSTANGVQMTQAYYLRKVDGYMMAVIVTIPGGYTVAEIEALFQ